MPQHRKLTPGQTINLKRLIRDFPHLTNEQIGRLIGCSDSTVGAERRGTRTPKSDAKRAAFEAAKATLTDVREQAPTLIRQPLLTGERTLVAWRNPSTGAIEYAPEEVHPAFNRPPQSEVEIVKKAALAVNVAKAMLPSLSDDEIEDQATRLMKLSDEDLVATYRALAAEDDLSGDDR